MNDSNLDRLITTLFLAIGFLVMIAWMGDSMNFQRSCESSCAGKPAMTPIIDLREVCFCDEGHGAWRKVDIERR
jgi:hypothetical protein